MGLNIKNRDVEELAREIAKATGETKTEAIRKALLDRKEKLGLPSVETRMKELQAMIREIHAGRTFAPVTKEEWDSLND
jgi:antitoxin VapB